MNFLKSVGPVPELDLGFFIDDHVNWPPTGQAAPQAMKPSGSAAWLLARGSNREVTHSGPLSAENRS